MRTYKTEPKKVIDKILCDVCGESCTRPIPTMLPSFDHEYATLEATWGYFSEQDGTQYNIELCENCFNDVLSFIKNQRRIILGPCKYPHAFDPLEGSCYFPS